MLPRLVAFKPTAEDVDPKDTVVKAIGERHPGALALRFDPGNLDAIAADWNYYLVDESGKTTGIDPRRRARGRKGAREGLRPSALPPCPTALPYSSRICAPVVKSHSLTKASPSTIAVTFTW